MENQEPTIKFVIKSEYLLKACKDVIQTWPGVSWNSDPLEVLIPLSLILHQALTTPVART